MRLKAKIDANQPEIVKALRQIGCSVQHLHQLGQGCPDILIGVAGFNVLAEIKDSAKPPSARNLTEDEQDWHDAWRGQVSIITCVDDALRVVRYFREQR